jgi:hypothetical protein
MTSTNSSLRRRTLTRPTCDGSLVSDCALGLALKDRLAKALPGYFLSVLLITPVHDDMHFRSGNAAHAVTAATSSGAG